MPMFLSCGRTFSVIHDFVNLVLIKPPLAMAVQRPTFVKKKIYKRKIPFWHI
jgi:hypothetical protein